MPDLGGRHELEHRVDHPEAGSQDRHEPDPIAELLCRGHLDRGLHVAGPKAGVGEGLVAEEPRQLPHDLAELLRLGRLVAKNPELVLDRRMFGDMERHCAAHPSIAT